MQTDFSVQHKMTAIPATDRDFSLITRSGGGSFFVRVEREVAPSVYALRNGNTLFEARSLRALTPGDVLFVSAFYDRAAGELQLTVLPQNNAAPGASFLAGYGIPDDPLSRRIMAVLCGLGARLDPQHIKKLRSIAARFSGRETDAAEAAAVLLDKDLAAGYDAIDAVLDFDRGSGHRRGNSGSNRDILEQFNKARDSGANWIAVPFSLPPETPGAHTGGCIRFLCDEKLRVLKKCTVTVVSPRRRWIFDIHHSGDAPEDSVFVDTYSTPVLTDDKIKIFERMVEDFCQSFDIIIKRFIYKKDTYHTYSGTEHDVSSVSTIV